MRPRPASMPFSALNGYLGVWLQLGPVLASLYVPSARTRAFHGVVPKRKPREGSCVMVEGRRRSKRADLELKMQRCLDRLGVPLKAVWVPRVNSAKHGEINSCCLYIYDKEESEAWRTFEHEVYEFNFKEVTYAYRTLVNSLIEAVEKLTYERKEKFLEFLPRISQVVREEKT